MKCPRCESFESKDRQQLFRHMISKHKVLDQYLADAIEQMKAEGKQPFLGPSGPQAAATSTVPVMEAAATSGATDSSQASINIPQMDLPTFSETPEDREPSPQPGTSSTMAPSASKEPVTLPEFLAGENKPEKIMQVDGQADSESETEDGEDTIIQLGKIIECWD